MGSQFRSLIPTAILFFFSVLLVLSSALDMSIIGSGETHRRSDDEVASMFESWLVSHGKNYNALGEKERRFQIFKHNLRFIDEHNAENRSYKLGLNRFADLTNEEYRSKYLGAKAGSGRRLTATKTSDRYVVKDGESLPDAVDWREKGAVVDVKDQGSCGMF